MTSSELQTAGLTFLLVFSLVSLASVIAARRKLEYPYLTLGALALGVEVGRQILNFYLITHPEQTGFYFLSAALIVLSALLILHAFRLHNRASVTWPYYLTLVTGFAAFVTLSQLGFDRFSVLSWYLIYSPLLLVLTLIVRETFLILKSSQGDNPWPFLIAAMGLLGRLVVPHIIFGDSPQYGFYYLVTSLLHALLAGSLVLIALNAYSKAHVHLLNRHASTEATLRFVFDNTEDAIISHNHTGIILSWNQRAQDLFGYWEADVVGKLNVQQLLLPIAPKKPGSRRNYMACRQDGSQRQVEVSRREIRASGNAFYTLVIRDVSQLEAVQEEKAQLDARLSQFERTENLGLLAGGLAHDFNNLVAAIQGHAQLALRYLGNRELAAHELEQVLAAAKTATGLTEQMLNHAGSAEFAPESVDIPPLMESCLAIMAPSLNHVEVSCDFAPGHKVLGDPGQLSQVFMNLIKNAAEAVPGSQGLLHIATAPVSLDKAQLDAMRVSGDLYRGEYLKVTISDNGMGMNDDTLDGLFRPFYSTKSEGRGLGLSAVASIIKRHRAGLQVHSQPGEGTRFDLYLPLISAAAQALLDPGSGLEIQD